MFLNKKRLGCFNNISSCHVQLFFQFFPRNRAVNFSCLMTQNAPKVIYYIHSCLFCRGIREKRRICCAGICTLSKCKYLVIPNLQIIPTRCGEICCIRSFQHIIAIPGVLYLQANAKAAITPYLIIYHTRWFLRCQNEMNAETASNTCGANELIHKFWLLHFQFCKFIRNQNQMRKRLGDFFAAIHLLIAVNINVCTAGS